MTPKPPKELCALISKEVINYLTNFMRRLPVEKRGLNMQINGVVWLIN